MKPAEIVQLQVEAYNKRDLEEFLSFYSENIKIYQFNDETLLFGSIEEMKEAYGPVFEQKTNLNAVIQKRIEQGNFVIDHEFVSGLREDETVPAVAIYEVLDDKIQFVWFIK